MRKPVGVLMVTALVMAACGGGDDGADNEQNPAESGNQAPLDTDEAGADDSDSQPASGGSSDEPTPEASGSLEPNSIRIGDDVWRRTLPMTSGQCFLQEDDGTLPDSGTAWGTLDNNDDLDYSANYGQDGTFDAEVRSDTMFWAAGERIGTELTIELDFATQTISGEGLFNNLHDNERAYGSFQFTCEENEG